MNIVQETDNQQPSFLNKEKGSETIPKGSTQEIVEAVSILTSKVEDDDIVQKFIKKSLIKHNNQFDYSKIKYINAKTHIELLCKKHNHIFKQSPDKHLNTTYPCPLCLTERRKQKSSKRYRNKPFKSLDFYLYKLYTKYNINFKLIDDYKGINSIIEFTCNEHGIQTNSIKNLLLQEKVYSCTTCAKNNAIKNRTKTKESINHSGFSINFDNYKNRKSIVECTCPKHGVFYKKVQKIVSGQGCFKCRIEELVKNNILVGGYSEELFNKKPELKNISAILYLLKINDIYKIGITTKNINDRIKGLKAKAKKYNEILEITILNSKYSTLYNCFLEEQNILQEYSDKRIYKKWSTELIKDFDENKF